MMLLLIEYEPIFTQKFPSDGTYLWQKYLEAKLDGELVCAYWAWANDKNESEIHAEGLRSLVLTKVCEHINRLAERKSAENPPQ